MRRVIGLLLALTLLIPAAMAELGDPGLESAALPADQAVAIDLDGDGAAETVIWTMAPVDEYDSKLVLRVTLADGATLDYDTEFIGAEAVFAADMDGDGSVELLLTGDIASDDYFTVCLHLANGALIAVPFADGNRGENTDQDQEMGYGYPVRLDGSAITLSGSQDVLGTWFGARVYALEDGRFGFADDGEWVRDLSDIDLSDETFWAEGYAPLTTKTALGYTAADGSRGELPAGAQLLITGSDKASYARFVTKDGIEGKLSITADAEKGWGMLVDGVSEDDMFERVPYAD